MSSNIDLLCSAGCGKSAELRCSKCLCAVYCTQDCQKLAWPQHKEPCKLVVKTNAEIDEKQKFLILAKKKASVPLKSIISLDIRMTTDLPAFTCRQGFLHGSTIDGIVNVLGQPNCDDDKRKVSHSWIFSVADEEAPEKRIICRIWSYRGSEKAVPPFFSTYGPAWVFQTLFPPPAKHVVDGPITFSYP